MEQTFIAKKNNSNGSRAFIILDTDKKTYQTGNTGGTSLNWRKSDLVIKVESIKAVKEDLQYGDFCKI